MVPAPGIMGELIAEKWAKSGQLEQVIKHSSERHRTVERLMTTYGDCVSSVPGADPQDLELLYNMGMIRDPLDGSAGFMAEGPLWVKTQHSYPDFYDFFAANSGSFESMFDGYSRNQVIDAQAHRAAFEKFFADFENWVGSKWGCRTCPGQLYVTGFPEGSALELLTDDPANPRIAVARLFTCPQCRRFTETAASVEDVASARRAAFSRRSEVVDGPICGTVQDPNNFEYQCRSMTEYRELLQTADAIGTTTARRDRGFIRLEGESANPPASAATGVTPFRAAHTPSDSADSQDDPLGIRLEVATRLVGWGAKIFRSGGRDEEAVEVFDEVVATYGRDADTGVRERVAKALFLKGGALVNLRRLDDAVEVFGEVIATYGFDAYPRTRSTVAESLLQQGAALAGLGRFRDSVALCDRLVDTYGFDAETGTRTRVATALLLKGGALGEWGRHGLMSGADAVGGYWRFREAVAVYDLLVDTYGRDEATDIQEVVAEGLANKGTVLSYMGRHEDAARVADQVVATYGRDESPGAQRAVAAANRVISDLVAEGRHNPRQYGGNRAHQAKKEGCYIATAVYGSYDAPEVMTLRRFRDTKLAVTPTGRSLIRVYYKASPRLAKRFTAPTRLTGVVRKALDSFVEHLEQRSPE